MANLSFICILSILTLCLSAAATPVANKRFSFRTWVEDIIQNPDGNHLSPEEAIAAWQASAQSNYTRPFSAQGNYTRPFGHILRARGDPATCNESQHTGAPIPDAVYCIRSLAAKGTQDCPTDGYAEYCQFQNALIDGTGTKGTRFGSYCNDIARGAGYIMDSCSRIDNTVEGSGFVEGNGEIKVRIHGVEDTGNGH
ncbi:hypothetical protein V8F20_003897 [Naviculisporaceae sp. PSN 640]